MNSRLRLGTAPDSWGVWYADDPAQLPWQRFLDEATASGYEWIELGPYGYLPTDAARLHDELAGRGLTLSGGTVAAGLHHGVEALERAVEECRREARLLTALGARHLVLLPEQYTELDGSLNQAATLDAAQWRCCWTARACSPGCCTKSSAWSWSSTPTPTATSTPRNT